MSPGNSKPNVIISPSTAIKPKQTLGSSALCPVKTFPLFFFLFPQEETLQNRIETASYCYTVTNNTINNNGKSLFVIIIHGELIVNSV